MKTKRLGVGKRYWRGGKVPLGVEYYHFPSKFAQDFLLHVAVLGRSSTPTGFRHQHEHEARFLLHYIRRGELWHQVRERVHRLGSGSVCLMDLREPVRYGNDGPRAADNWWVCFDGKESPHLQSRLCADENPVFTGVNLKRFETLFRELLAITVHKPPAYEWRASGLLTLLLAELSASRRDEEKFDIDLVPIPKQTGPLSLPVRDSLRYMARFYRDRLDLKGLSSVSRLSLYHFAHQFQRETGMSPMNYLSRYRIEQARRILSASHHPIHQVAKMVGISNPFNFSRLFHKFAGSTPAKYRARARRLAVMARNRACAGGR
ncbi:MAG: helix-turn-helix transcriptional regulator [Verrucomicrobia bacterium]|nr:helix-turn-helix transcriptional regulator [Verrucomicrobiota bacterium]